MPQDASGTETGSGDAPSSGSGAGEPFRPPNFLEALRSSWSGTRRPRARPVSGTDEDAKAVNYLNSTERTWVAVMAAFEIVIAIFTYARWRHAVIKPSHHPRVTVHQAHIDTFNVHHEAIYVLLVYSVLGLAVAGAAWSRRRALVGVTVLLSGFAMLTLVGIVGLLYLGIGIWLVFKAMKRRTADAVSATTPVRASKTSSSPGRRTATAAPAVRTPPAPSKRYTPPRRPVGTKTTEKPSRLPSWLRR